MTPEMFETIAGYLRMTQNLLAAIFGLLLVLFFSIALPRRRE